MNSITTHVKLGKDPIKIPVTSQEQKFLLEPCNQQLVSIFGYDIGFYCINKEREAKLYRLEREGISNAKLSLDQNFVGIQTRNQKTSIEFVDLNERKGYVQSCRRPNKAEIYDFFWTFPDNIFFATSSGIELYQFPPSGRRSDLKLLKEQKVSIPWFYYSTKHRILLVPSSTSSTSTTIQGFHFVENNIQKIPKFTIEHKEGSLEADQLHISLLYGKLFCVHLSHSTKEETNECQQISLYQLTREIIVKRYTITMPSPGKIEFHVVDNLLVIHNTSNKLVMLFDIKQKEHSFPVASPLPLSMDSNKGKVSEFNNDNWMFFQPYWMFDKKKGYLWQVELNLDDIALSLNNKKKLVHFLLKRKNSKQLVLNVLKTMILDLEPLPTLSQIFDKINHVLASHAKSSKAVSKKVIGPNVSIRESISAISDSSSQNGLGFSFSLSGEALKSSEQIVETRTQEGFVIIEQTDMYSHVFLPGEEKGLDFKYMIAVLIEYIRSLNFKFIAVEPFIFELLIRFLVYNDRFYQLHQLLQYHVVTDSVHVACQLLSLESKYPPAFQLALDMLKRLHNNEQIVEVLLLKKQVTTALRFIRAHRGVKISASRFLETALSIDRNTFCIAYKFFQSAKIDIDKNYTKIWNEYTSKIK